jgi:SHS2 domain-containing protein
MGEFNYIIDVQDSKSAAAPKTKYHKSIKGENTNETTVTILSNGLFPVQSGKTIAEDILVNKLFDVSRPDKYAIQVQRADETTNIVVKSNTITLTVIP